jgi:hypothetical protein
MSAICRTPQFILILLLTETKEMVTSFFLVFLKYFSHLNQLAAIGDN